jgi:hypothetical protein
VLNHNPGSVVSNLFFQNIFLDSLIFRALDGLPYTYRLVDADNPLTLEELARYSLVIVSSENRHGSITEDLVNALPLYLANGGKIILMLRHAAVEQSPNATPHVVRFAENSFVSRYLMIDSTYIGPLTLLPGFCIAGDLIGAMPEGPDWPSLTWDSVRVNQFGYGAPDGIPYCGYFWPHLPAEIVYRYHSGNPDSTTHGQVDGIRYIGDDYSFYLLNFPLSLMEVDSAAAMLRGAVFDLGEYFICGDANQDRSLNIGDVVTLVRYLYQGEEDPGIFPAGDVDCSGDIEMSDVLILINFLFRGGLAPECCR